MRLVVSSSLSFTISNRNQQGKKATLRSKGQVKTRFVDELHAAFIFSAKEIDEKSRVAYLFCIFSFTAFLTFLTCHLKTLISRPL